MSSYKERWGYLLDKSHASAFLAPRTSLTCARLSSWLPGVGVAGMVMALAARRESRRAVNCMLMFG